MKTRSIQWITIWILFENFTNHQYDYIKWKKKVITAQEVDGHLEIWKPREEAFDLSDRSEIWHEVVAETLISDTILLKPKLAASRLQEIWRWRLTVSDYHYSDFIMSVMVSQTNSVLSVYLTVYSGAD